MPLSKIEVPSLDVGQLGGRRNMLINGGCSVWQRGTSHTSGGLSYYSIDRWWTYNVNGTLQRSTTVPAGEGFAYSMNMAGTWNSLGQPIELPAQGVTMLKPNTDYCISFWVKGVTTTTTPYVAHRYRDTKGSGTGNVNIDGGTTSYTITPDWQRIAIVFNTGTTVPASTNNILDIEFAGWGATQTDTYLTGFQFEEGSTPSPFEHENIGTTLQKCQRYLYSLTNGSTGYVCPFWQYNGNPTINGWVKFPTTMRVEPSLVYNTQGQTNWVVCYGNGVGLSMDTFTLNEQTLDSAVLYNSQVNIGQGKAGGFYVASTSAVIQFDAEL